MPQCTEKQGITTKSGVHVPVKNANHVELVKKVYKGMNLKSMKAIEDQQVQNSNGRIDKPANIEVLRSSEIEYLDYKATQGERAIRAEHGDQVIIDAIHAETMKYAADPVKFETEYEKLSENYDIDTVLNREELEYQQYHEAHTQRPEPHRNAAQADQLEKEGAFSEMEYSY